MERYGKGLGIDSSSSVVNCRTGIKMAVEHTLAGNWWVIFSFTFKSSGTTKHTNVAVICGQNRVRELRTALDPVYEPWVGLFGEPSKDFNLADNASITIAELSHDPTLEESEVLRGVEDILFSQFSNNLGQVLGSKLPMEFVVPHDDPSPNRGNDRVFCCIDNGSPFKISVQHERTSYAPTGNRNRRKRLRDH
jgi:hypothetical protein